MNTLHQYALNNSPDEPSKSSENNNHLTEIENPIDIMTHELKQPLLCILALAERIESSIEKIENKDRKKVMTRDIKAMLTSIQQMKEIMTTRSVLSKLRNLEEGWYQNIQEHMEAIQTIAQRRRIEIAIKNRVNQSEKGIDPQLITQVISNLVTNAADELEQDKTEKKEIEIHLFNKNKDLVIQVHDSGKGISPKIAQSIFQKGFTTKSETGGSGYGLWVCSQITEALGGKLKAGNSDVLTGACFEFTCPQQVEQSLEQVA